MPGTLNPNNHQIFCSSINNGEQNVKKKNEIELLFSNFIESLHRSNPEQNHGDDDEEQVEGFALYVLLLEEKPTGKESYYNTRTANEADDRDERSRNGQCIEIAEISYRKED